jgi:hypothetical protein
MTFSFPFVFIFPSSSNKTKINDGGDKRGEEKEDQTRSGVQGTATNSRRSREKANSRLFTLLQVGDWTDY